MTIYSYPPELLATTPGRGNSVTYFAARAAFLWENDIPRAGTISHSERREMVVLLARMNNLNVCELVAIVRMHKSAIRRRQVWPPSLPNVH